MRVLLPITLGHFILGMIFMITDSLSTIIQIILLSIRGVMCLSQWFITAYPWHEIKQEWYSGIIKTLSHNTRNIVSVIFCKLLSGFGKGSFHAQSHLNISRSYFLVGSFKAQNRTCPDSELGHPKLEFCFGGVSHIGRGFITRFPINIYKY